MRGNLFISLCAVLIAMPLHSATISFVIGDVRAGREGDMKRAVIDMAVNPGDTVTTAHRSLAIIRMKESVIKLRDGSSVKLTSDAPGNAELDLLSGSVFSKVLREQAGGLRIRAAAMVASVRGTEFFMAFVEKRKSHPDLWLCVNKGTVEVLRLADKKAVLIREGEGVLLPRSNEFTDPKQYEWTKGLNWNMDPGKGDVIDRTDLNRAYPDILKQNYD